MNLTESPIHTLIDELHAELGEAAKQADNAKIFAITERLKQADNLNRQVDALNKEVAAFIRPQKNNAEFVEKAPLESESRRLKGKRLRANWLAVHGKTLKHLRHALYQNSKGEIVGIACGSERLMNSGGDSRFWLGLPIGEFDNAVLLCEGSDKKVHAVCLSKVFIDSVRKQLSKSEKQEQFTVLKHAKRWMLQVPGMEHIDISQFLDNSALID